MEPSSGCTSVVPARRGTRNQAIGRSRGGLTTKIVALVDALGNLVRFILLSGQQHDGVGVAPLIGSVHPSRAVVICDDVTREVERRHCRT